MEVGIDYWSFRLYFEAVIIDSFGYPHVIVSKEVGSYAYFYHSCFGATLQDYKKLVLYTGSVSMTGNMYFVHFLIFP